MSSNILKNTVCKKTGKGKALKVLAMLNNSSKTRIQWLKGKIVRSVRLNNT
jgi:hypothetical protein